MRYSNDMTNVLIYNPNTVTVEYSRVLATSRQIYQQSINCATSQVAKISFDRGKYLTGSTHVLVHGIVPKIVLDSNVVRCNCTWHAKASAK